MYIRDEEISYESNKNQALFTLLPNYVLVPAEEDGAAESVNSVMLWSDALSTVYIFSDIAYCPLDHSSDPAAGFLAGTRQLCHSV